MKTSFLALACALALGTAGGALAAGTGSSTQKSDEPSAVDKTKSTIRNAGEKLGHKLHLDKGQQQAAGDSHDKAHEKTHAMGASGKHQHARKSDTTQTVAETTRQERMDAAYQDWQAQHGEQKR